MTNTSELYKSAITLLIESDKKRDQIIVFYSGFITLFLQFILPIYKDNPILFLIINFVLIIFSGVIGLVIITLRKWHNIYNATAYILRNQTIVICNKSNEIIDKYWDSYVQFYKNNSKGFPFSTENLVFLAYIILSSIPIITFIVKLWSQVVENPLFFNFINGKFMGLFDVDFLLYYNYGTLSLLLFSLISAYSLIMLIIYNKIAKKSLMKYPPKNSRKEQIYKCNSWLLENISNKFE